MHDLDAVLAQAARWKAAGQGVAIATVIRTWGSSPRPAGSKLAVNQAGEFVGSVSGGCIEAAVITEALEIIAGAEPRVLSFGVSDETAWDVGLACGGRVEVFVEAKLAALESLRTARAAGQPVALATWLDGRDALVIDPAAAPAALAPTVAQVLREERAQVVTVDGAEIFVEPHLPAARLVLVGAVHIAEPLAAMAALAGFAVTIVDPRRAWATPARFPGQTLVTTWPDEAMRALAPDLRTAVVTLTHDPKLDDPALIAALATPAFYVGCLGSQKTHAARKTRLAEAGVTATALERLRGPVGLRIGARSPAEIAVSILAEIVATMRSTA